MLYLLLQVGYTIRLTQFNKKCILFYCSLVDIDPNSSPARVPQACNPS